MESINYPAPKLKYKVLVRCFTYNQSKYIEDALNGFAMQQTSFPFVCLVMDDASTDGEQDIIKKWMERECDMDKAEAVEIQTSIVITVPHKTNASCTFVFYFLKQNLYKEQVKKIEHVAPWREQCEYEALCEGDDYWINSDKLQAEVDYMDLHPKCSLVFTDFNIKYESLSKEIKSVFKSGIRRPSSSFVTHLIGRNYIGPCTWLYKPWLIDKLNDNFVDGTFGMALDAYAQSEVGYLSITTATYRVLRQSASHSKRLSSQLAFNKALIMEQLYYMEKYPLLVEDDTREKVLISSYKKMLPKLIAINDRPTIDEARKIFKEYSFVNYVKLVTLNNSCFSYILKRFYIMRGYTL